MPAEAANTREKGRFAEDIAAAYLEKKGYKIIKRNFVFGRTGELDIIAEISGILVFVEVRSKSSGSTYDPILSIDYKKQKTIKRTAEGYLYVNKITDKECRLDVIIVDLSHKEPDINHIESAFY